ncbi:MAG: flagellin [Planctomycetota bacterium]|nr:flagellin [Planctomycetota bacterium]
MNIIHSALGRTPTLLQWQHAAQSLGRGNSALAEVQIQLATGRSLLRPSDDAVGAGAISVLDGLLEVQRQRERNLDHGEAMLGMIDGSLGEALDLVLQAKGIGLDQSTSGVDAAERQAQAVAIDSILTGLFDIANSNHQGVHLFGGSATARSPFVNLNGLIQYVGQGGGLITDLGLASGIPLTLGGEEAFGAVSTRVEGYRDLDPSIDLSTPLNELNGATGEGVTLGIVEVFRDPPGTSYQVDLSNAFTLQDVVNEFQAMAGLDVTLDLDAQGLFINVPAGETITITDMEGGHAARDLGIDMVFTGPDGGVGGDLDRRLTDNTPVSALGFDLGMVRFSNGHHTMDLSLATAETVGDIRRLVEQMDMGVRLDINESGDRLDAVNLRSGSLMSIGEVIGNTTATDLGIRSMDRDTLLSDFNRGLGVSILSGNIDPVTGALDPTLDRDFAVNLSNGEQFVVDLAGCQTLGDVLDQIRAEADDKLADPGVFEVGLALEGNGIRLEDNSAGGGTFSLADLNGSDALADLGLDVAASGAIIIGEDRAMVVVEGVFTHLMDLRDALMGDDVTGIALAADRLEGDLDRLGRVQAEVGIRTNRITDAMARIEDTIMMDEQLRSRILDLDYTEASIRYASLQQQLQAGLATAARSVSMTLLDYL